MIRKALYAAGVLFILAIFLVPRPPLQDYADWIYQAKVFKEILTSSPAFSAEFSLRPPVVPNSASTVLMGLMCLLLPPDLTGRIFVAVTFVLLFFGLRRLFVTERNPDILADSLALLFVPTYFFFLGLLSYNFGLALILLLMSRSGLVLNDWRAALKYALLFSLLYYVHFIVMLMSVTVLLAMRVSAKKKRDVNLRYLFLSLVPVAILFVLYLTGPSAEIAPPTILGYKVAGKLNHFLQGLSVVYRFNDHSSAKAMSILVALNALSVVGLIYLFLYLLKGAYKELRRQRYVVMGAAFILAAIASPFYIAGFGYDGDRFFWFGVVVLLAAALQVSRRINSRLGTTVALVSISVLVARLLMFTSQGVDDHGFEVALKATIPNTTSFLPLMITYDFPEYYPSRSGAVKYLARMCPIINTRNRVPLYLILDRNQVYKGIFKTGILRAAPFDCDVKSFIDRGAGPAGQDCRTILLVSPDGFTDDVKTKIEERYAVVREGRGYMFASTPR